MLDALVLNAQSPLSLIDGRYRRQPDHEGHAPATIHALADRGLLRLSAGHDGALRRYKLTDAGHVVVHEIRRRAENRARLIAEKPSRAPELRR